MVIKTGDTKAYQDFRGGSGTIYITWLVENPPYDKSPIRKIALVEIPPGSSIGFHIHDGTEEIYYILSGKGIYTDGDRDVEISAGTLTITPSGTGHAIKNPGPKTLKLLAVINGVEG